MPSESAQQPIDYDLSWRHWGDMIRYSPAPFHRRRMMLRLARDLRFSNVLDVGCGNAEMLAAFARAFPHAELHGADVSAEVIETNRARFPHARFSVLDLGENPLDGEFDLVLCTEVVEHVADWRRALRHLRSMCRGHLVLTVPSGKVFPIDKAVGHYRHFEASELAAALRDSRFEPEVVLRWGFPFHTLYKTLINVAPGASMQAFASSEYGPAQKAIGQFLSTLFYFNVNDSPLGRQLVVRARAV